MDGGGGGATGVGVAFVGLPLDVAVGGDFSAIGGQGLFLPEKLGLDFPDIAGLVRLRELRILGAGLLLRTSQARERRSGFGFAS